jgi:hypothetical protein
MNEGLIKSTLANWLQTSLGQPQIIVLNFSADFVPGNVITIQIDLETTSPVTYTTSHANTLQLFARALQDTNNVFKALVTGPRQITITGAINGVTYTVFSPVITGGVSQPTMSLTVSQAAIRVQVIYADQNGPRPSFPYAVLRLSDFVKTSKDEIRQINPARGIYEVGGERRLTAAVDYFGNNPIQEITKAYNSLEKRDIVELLITANLAVIDKNPIQNLTAVLETEYEPHSFFDFFLGLTDNIEDDLGIIESVQTTGTYVGTSSGSSYVDTDLIEGDV